MRQYAGSYQLTNLIFFYMFQINLLDIAPLKSVKSWPSTKHFRCLYFVYLSLLVEIILFNIKNKIIYVISEIERQL